MKIKVEYKSGNGKVMELEKCVFIAHQQDGDDYIAKILFDELMEHNDRKIINWDAVESIREWKD